MGISTSGIVSSLKLGGACSNGAISSFIRNEDYYYDTHKAKISRIPHLAKLIFYTLVINTSMKPFKKELERIKEKGLIPVVIIEEPEKAVPLGKAFLDAGLDIMEITMRTQRAIEAIKILRKELPKMLVGAGTVTSLPAAKEAIKAGARFIVSPHLDEEIVAYCVKKDIIVIPGVYTPTEVNRAIQAAIKAEGDEFTNMEDLPLLLKIYPASSGGLEHIKALKAVFPHARFIPLGGINAKNLADFIKAGAWAIGGTWICKRELIDTGEMAKISELTREALQIIKEAKA